MSGATLHAVHHLLKQARFHRIHGEPAIALSLIEEARAWNRNTINVPVWFNKTWMDQHEYQRMLHDEEAYWADWSKYVI